MAKLTISINDDLLASIDDYAEKNYMTRSGFISFCCNQFLVAQRLQSALGEMTVCLRQVADSVLDGKVDESALKQLQQYEAFVKLLSQNK